MPVPRQSVAADTQFLWGGKARQVLRSESMADQNANADPKINRCLEELKSKIPAADHAALDSRLQSLINDPDADDDDVISILRAEFAPEHE